MEEGGGGGERNQFIRRRESLVLSGDMETDTDRDIGIRADSDTLTLNTWNLKSLTCFSKCHGGDISGLSFKNDLNGLIE